MKEIIGVTSYKGGVGTSTAAYGIARALAKNNSSVCLVDCKHCGDLDIMLGVEDQRLMGFDDLLYGRSLEDTVLNLDSFDFCGAPYNKESWSDGIKARIKESKYDVVVLDSPRDISICTRVVVVTTVSVSSVRAAECLADESLNLGIETGIVVNRFGELEKVLGVESIMDSTHSRLYGIVPYVPFLSEGEEAFEKDNAMKNIASRLMGGNVPIFEGSKQKNKLKKILNKK